MGVFFEDSDSVGATYDFHLLIYIFSFSLLLLYSGNAELYCKVGVPFVMGTTGGDRDLLHKTVEDSKVYAVISPQMGKQVCHNFREP